MTQASFNLMEVCCFHRYLLDGIEIVLIAKEFSAQSDIRLSLFGIGHKLLGLTAIDTLSDCATLRCANQGRTLDSGCGSDRIIIAKKK